MIRTVKHKSGEYITVNTTLEVKEGDKVLKVPVFVQVEVTPLDSKESIVVMKAANGLFNRTIAINLTKPVKDEKSWWQKLFNR